MAIAIYVIVQSWFTTNHVPQYFPPNDLNQSAICSTNKFSVAEKDIRDETIDIMAVRGGVLPGANGLPVTPTSRPMSPYGQPRVNRGVFPCPTAPQHVPGTKIGNYSPNGTFRNGGPSKSVPPGCPSQMGRTVTGLSASKKSDENQSTNKYKVSKEMSSTLSKISKKVRKDADTRKGLDKLAKQLGNGELHAGRGTKKLPGTETVFYMRSGGEARLFFKYADKDKGVVHVIAESDKDNETKVMDNIKKNYE